MHKKTDFLLGLLLGGTAAVIAFKRMDPARRHQLLNKANRKMGKLKNQAVDYAFYANNEFNNTSKHLKKKTHDAHTTVQTINDRLYDRVNRAHYYQKGLKLFQQSVVNLKKAFRHLPRLNRSAGDIVLNADAALHDSKTVVYYPNGTTKKF